MANISRWVTHYFTTTLPQIRGNIRKDAQQAIEREAEKARTEAQIKTYEKLGAQLKAANKLTLGEISTNMGSDIYDAVLDDIFKVKTEHPRKDVRRLETSFKQTLAFYKTQREKLDEREKTIEQAFAYLLSCTTLKDYLPSSWDEIIPSLLPKAVEQAKPLLSGLKKQSRYTSEQIEAYQKLHLDIINNIKEAKEKWYLSIKNKKTNTKELIMPLERRMLALNGALRVLADISLSLKERMDLATRTLSGSETVTPKPFDLHIQTRPMGSNQRQRARAVPRHRSLPLG